MAGDIAYSDALKGRVIRLLKLLPGYQRSRTVTAALDQRHSMAKLLLYILMSSAVNN